MRIWKKRRSQALEPYEPKCTEKTVYALDQGVLVSATKRKECCLVQIYPTDVVEGMFRLEGETVTLGRDARCELTISDHSVSRRHACLELTEGGYRLRDLGSTNGTFVNEQRIDSVLLKGDERIRIGSYIFKFLSADCIEAQYHETVYDAMTRDGLTQAFNKSYLMDALGYELARSRRCGRPLCLLMLDLDYFKQINDKHGHLAGDEVLKEFCRRISSVTRSDDLLCRYGGEEFAIVLGETSVADALETAERCRAAISALPFQTTAGDIKVTVSVGLAELPGDSEEWTPASLIQAADVQLYRAKQSGRDCVCWVGSPRQIG